jgi:hypothetical protein
MSLMGETGQCVRLLTRLQALMEVRSYTWKIHSLHTLISNVAICKRLCRLPSRCKPICAAVLFDCGRGTPAGVLVSACLRTRDEHCAEHVFQSGHTGSGNNVGQRGRLGRVSQRTGGSFRLCQGGGLLARRTAGCPSIWRQDSASVGDGDGHVSQRAEGSFTRCQGGGLLVRRTACRLSIRRQNSASVGDGDGHVSQRA